MTMGSLRAALLGGILHGLALLPPLPGVGPAADSVLRFLLVVSGLLLVAHGVRVASDGLEAARAGLALGGGFSFVALHWVPSAAEPWFGVVGGGVAGVVVWSFHAVLAAAVMGLMARCRRGLPFPLVFGSGWVLLEWLPGAIPLVHLPRPELASLLVDSESVLAPASWVGGVALLGIWAACLAALVEWVARPGGLRGGAASAADRGAATDPPGPAPSVPGTAKATTGILVASLLILVSTAGWDRFSATSGRSGGHLEDPGGGTTVAPAVPDTSNVLVVARIPLSREALSDPERRRAELTRGVGVAPADVWPETLLPDAGVQPGGATPGLWPVAGMRWESGRARYNALARVLPDDSTVLLHRKVRLVPGVERTRLLRPGIGEGRGLAPGPSPTAFELGGRRVGGLICFEFLFPGVVAAQRRDGATLLVHAANDAMLTGGGWWPMVPGVAMDQQDRMLRLRAVEYRVPIVRSTLVGGSGVGGARSGRTRAQDAGAWDGRGRPVPMQPVPATGRERLQVELPEAAPPPPATWLARFPAPLAGILLATALLRARRPSRMGNDGVD